jgi:hypothetical protein
MGAGVVACPRCGRSSTTWTFERDQWRAGCPCGEVIPYDFDDAPLVPIATTPRRPRHWREDAQLTAFRATLRPSMRRLWLALPLALAVFLAQLAHFALVGLALGGVPGAVLPVVALCALAAWAISQQARRWTFAIEGGHFRAEARGHDTDILLEQIQSFAVSAPRKNRERKAADAAARFDLVVLRTDGARVRVPLFVEDADEAQFVAERANALLATAGRTIGGDYRGQRIRVAEVDAAVEPGTAVRVGDLEDDVVPPSEDTAAIDAPRAARRRDETT